MNKLKTLMIIGFVICFFEMKISHDIVVHSIHYWDGISLMVNIFFYILIFIFSYLLLLFVLRFYKQGIQVYIAYFFPYLFLFLYYIFIAMPEYVSYSVTNLLLFPLFPVLVAILTFFYFKSIKKQNQW